MRNTENAARPISRIAYRALRPDPPVRQRSAPVTRKPYAAFEMAHTKA